MSSFGRQVKSTATCLATSAGELADVTPDCFATAALACALASCTTSGTPALARFVAIGPPIVPRPMKPTRSRGALIPLPGGPEMAPRPPALGRAPAKPWRASGLRQDVSSIQEPL